MYVVNITYTAPLDRVDDALEAHRAFLERQFDAGVFIAAGPKLPRTGGIILAAVLTDTGSCASAAMARPASSSTHTTEMLACVADPGSNSCALASK